MGEKKDSPALQVIVLGSGGGPQESNITAFLVRAVAQEWSKNSIVAVDAGVHLSVITRLIEESLPSPRPTGPYTLTTGPFAGLKLPNVSSTANAAHITRSLVDTYLITHPHLDHISGFVVNTAGLPGTRPKKLAGLPSTIQAFKQHIFNNVIWPNLTDENNGAGLVTYLRLVEGGSPHVGDGEGKGYIEVCDGLLVKTWGVSHGHSVERHGNRGSSSSASTRFGSYDASSQMMRRDTHMQIGGPPSYALSRTHSLLGQGFTSSASQMDRGAFGSMAGVGSAPAVEQDRFCVYDSSAYFIQDHDYRKEVLIFGDVEPDSISLSPRNQWIWQEAAPKIAAETLAAIFIECSYDDSQSNDRLFGHLKPYYIMEEMRVLAGEVNEARKMRRLESSKKRKRQQSVAQEAPRKSANNARLNQAEEKNGTALELDSASGPEEDPVSPKTVHTTPADGTDPHTPRLADPTKELSLNDVDMLDPALNDNGPLHGLKVIIIHVKERLTDGPETGQTILKELLAYEKVERLGCEFIISHSGQSFYF